MTFKAQKWSFLVIWAHCQENLDVKTHAEDISHLEPSRAKPPILRIHHENLDEKTLELVSLAFLVTFWWIDPLPFRYGHYWLKKICQDLHPIWIEHGLFRTFLDNTDTEWQHQNPFVIDAKLITRQSFVSGRRTSIFMIGWTQVCAWRSTMTVALEDI